MAHYDCKNCGAHLGIDYGECEECTPKEVFKLEKQLTTAKIEAEEKAYEYYWVEKKEIDRKTQRLKRLVKEFVDKDTKNIKEAYNDAFERGKKRGR